MLTLLASAALAADLVVLDGATWRSLQAPEPPPVLGPPPSAVLDRTVRLERTGDTWHLDMTFVVDGVLPSTHPIGPATAALVTLTVDGRARAAEVHTPPTGVGLAPHWLVEVPAGRHVVRAVADLVHSEPRIALLLPSSARGRVCVSEGQALLHPPAVVHAGCWLAASPVLTVGPAPALPSTPSTLVVGRSAVGLTVGDDEVGVHGRVSWTALRGRVEAVELLARGMGPDLVVDGPEVLRTTRDGDRVRVELRRALPGVVLDVRGTLGLGAGERGAVGLPELAPLGTARVTQALVLARDTATPVDTSVKGGELVAPDELPTWAADLVQGEPIAGWTGAVRGRVEVLRAPPVEAPPLVLDLAAFTVALSDEGRSLTQTSLTVRNERAAHLGLVVPEGHLILAAEVNGRPVALVRDGARWLVPLPRSVETVRGPLSFPVELTVLGPEGAAWAGARTERRLALPTLDAPIAVRRVTVNLPRGWEATGEAEAQGRVEAFEEGEGLAYGFGVADETRARTLYQEAVQSWLENDFRSAADKLDALGALGAENENTERLRANLDVVEGKDVDADERVVRVVKAQAQARAADDYRAQEDALREAERAEAVGDQARKVGALRKAKELADRLEGIEQEESNRQLTFQVRAVQAISAYEAEETEETPPEAGGAAEGVKGGIVHGVGGGIVGDVGGGSYGMGVSSRSSSASGSAATPSPDPAPPPPPAAPAAEERAPRIMVREISVTDFASIDVGGELVKPSGALLMAAPAAAAPPLEVTATGTTAVVPVQGATVRFQHLLVDPDDEVPVVLVARRSPPRRSP